MNENACKWVEALRSGEFKQTAGALRDAYGFCCLGVACELYRRETGRAEWSGDRFDGAAEVLPASVVDWLGLRTDSGEFVGDYTLVEENDGGADFIEIADIVESEPEGLFA